MDKMKFEPAVLRHGCFTKKRITSFPLKQCIFFSEKDPSSILLSCLSLILVQVSEITNNTNTSYKLSTSWVRVCVHKETLSLGEGKVC